MTFTAHNLSFRGPRPFLNLAQIRAVIAAGTGNDDSRCAVEAPGLTPEEQATRLACFSRGTRITTMRGEVAVEKLSPKDRILTMDNGFKQLRWLGSWPLGAQCLRATPALRPIRILAGALGNGLPLRDMLVAPRHCLLRHSVEAEQRLGTREVLAEARHLLGMPGIEVAEDMLGVEYWGLMLDRHEVIFADGTPVETLQIRTHEINALSPEVRAVLLAKAPHEPPQPARPLVVVSPPVEPVDLGYARKTESSHPQLGR